MEKRYRALRLVGLLYKILGVIILVLTLVSATGVCVTGILSGAALRNLSDQFNNFGPGISPLASTIAGITAALISLVVGALSGLTFYAIGEGIYLLISIEENTRAAAHPMVIAPVTPPASISEPAPQSGEIAP